jgi:thiopurine S-methyltransferase
MDLNRKSWEQRWGAERPGFHQSEVNTYLQEQTAWLLGGGDTGVYVPLCGASIDLDWLSDRFKYVVGSELVGAAVNKFYSERGQSPLVVDAGDYRRHTAGRVTILEGDALALPANELGDITAWYDRAAMIALRPELRRQYVHRLRSILPHGARGLLVTLSYDQTITAGPPWSVSHEEVVESYASWCDVEQVEVVQAERTPSKFGDTPVFETIYRLKRHAGD